MEMLDTGLAVWQILLFSAGVSVLICEAASPGIGILGAAAAALLLGSFLPGVLHGAIEWYAALLMLVGIVLMFVDSGIPGLGPFAAMGLVCLLGALLLAVSSVDQLLISVMSVVFFTFPALGFILWHMPKSKSMKDISLEESLKGDALAAKHPDYVSKTGVALTDLRPAGMVEIDQSRLHATTEHSAFISKGSPVRVLRMQNGAVVVEVLLPQENGKQGPS